MPRPDLQSADRYYDELDVADFDHIIAFGSRHFQRLPGKIWRKLSRRIRGAVCQFNDGGIIGEPQAGITFTFKESSKPRHHVIGWAADSDLCQSKQSEDALTILVDHPDYVSGRGDITPAIMNDVNEFRTSSVWKGRFHKVDVRTLSSPKGDGKKIPFDELCEEYSRAHLFILTHPESVGLSVIETATAGALAVVPYGFMPSDLLSTIRHVEFNGRIPWPKVMAKIDPQASRARAMKETWFNVTDRMLGALREFRR